MKIFITLMLSGTFVLATDISGTVVLPNGLLAANAQVALVGPDRPIGLGRARFWWKGFATPVVAAGKDGRFSLQSTNDGTAIIAVDENGYAEVELKDFENNSKIALRPWGRVEGVFHVGAGVGTNQQVLLDGGFDSTTRILLELNDFQDQTDQAGKFVFAHVPPGTWEVWQGDEWYGDTVTVRAGETNHIIVGGTGRALVAKLLVPDKVAGLNKTPLPPSRKYLKFLESETNGGGSYEVYASLYGADHQSRHARVTLDGTIRVEDVTPGRWWLTADVLKFPAEGGMAKTVATVGKEVIVPEIPGGRSDEPLDLGDLKPIVVHSLQVGEDAPPLVVKTADGGTFNLANHRGQYVLLDFEALVWGATTNASLDAVWQSYGSNERFAMLTLRVPPNSSGLIPNEKNRESWPVAQLEKLPWYEVKPLQASFGLQCDRSIADDPHLPAIFLVGPDGQIVRANLKGDEINTVLGRILVKK